MVNEIESSKYKYGIVEIRNNQCYPKLTSLVKIFENPAIGGTFLCLLMPVPSPDKWERVAAGRAFGVKLFCQNRQMRNYYQSIPDRLRPGLPTTASGVAQQDTCENYATAKHRENKSRKRGGMRV